MLCFARAYLELIVAIPTPVCKAKERNRSFFYQQLNFFVFKLLLEAISKHAIILGGAREPRREASLFTTHQRTFCSIFFGPGFVRRSPHVQELIQSIESTLGVPIWPKTGMARHTPLVSDPPAVVHGLNPAWTKRRCNQRGRPSHNQIILSAKSKKAINNLRASTPVRCPLLFGPQCEMPKQPHARSKKLRLPKSCG